MSENTETKVSAPTIILRSLITPRAVADILSLTDEQIAPEVAMFLAAATFLIAL